MRAGAPVYRFDRIEGQDFWAITKHEDIERIARSVVDDLFAEGNEGETDFVERIAAPQPIAVIGWLLGVPEPDWPKLFHWTNRILGATDQEYA